MGKREDQVGPHQKWRHQEGGVRKTCWKHFPEKEKLKWFGHCLRREPNHICAKSLRLEVSGRRSRGRPKKRWRDNIKEDMKKYQLTEDMAQYREYWMTKIMAGPAQGDGQERWESMHWVRTNWLMNVARSLVYLPLLIWGMNVSGDGFSSKE